MRAINHALAGAVIGTMITIPVVAIPVAFVSHFALDTFPHFGIDQKTDIKQPWFQKLLFLDVILCLALVGVLAVHHTNGWLLASVCAFVAASPDFASIPRFYRMKLHGNISRKTNSSFIKFHDEIQNEKPSGAVIELLWLPAMVFLLVQLTR